jgi:hypothetical protein
LYHPIFGRDIHFFPSLLIVGLPRLVETIGIVSLLKLYRTRLRESYPEQPAIHWCLLVSGDINGVIRVLKQITHIAFKNSAELVERVQINTPGGATVEPLYRLVTDVRFFGYIGNRRTSLANHD